MSDASEQKLTAINLKAALWDTLQRVRTGEMAPGAGDVVASQAREILRTVRTQLAIVGQSGRQVTAELIDLAEDTRTR